MTWAPNMYLKNLGKSSMGEMDLNAAVGGAAHCRVPRMRVNKNHGNNSDCHPGWGGELKDDGFLNMGVSKK